MPKAKYHPTEGWRLTDCCGAASKFYGTDQYMSCKACGKRVPMGQGNGSEYRDEVARIEAEIARAERTLNYWKRKLDEEVAKVS